MNVAISAGAKHGANAACLPAGLPHSAKTINSKKSEQKSKKNEETIIVLHLKSIHIHTSACKTVATRLINHATVEWQTNSLEKKKYLNKC